MDTKTDSADASWRASTSKRAIDWEYQTEVGSQLKE